MRICIRPTLRLVPLAVVLAAVLALPAGASAGQLVTIDTPTAPGPGPYKANVLLPDGYDPGRAYPLLLLLHGVGDAPNYVSWAQPGSGDIQRTAAGLDAIIVMPEANRGFYTDWFNGGKRGDPSWETYFLDTFLPFVERTYKIAPGRRNHAIAGLSMGGFGAAYLGGQRPDIFGAVASFSGFVQHQRPEAEAGLKVVGEVDYTSIFGPMSGAYATGHNPTRTAANLRSSRVFVTVGDGTADPSAGSSPTAVLGGGAAELELRQQNDEFAAALHSAGVPVDYRPGVGVHDWPYWRAALKEAIAWGLFAKVPESPSAWTLQTVRTHGRAWDVRYDFATAPEQVITFARTPGRLSVRGGTGEVTVTDVRTGCAATHSLPAEQLLPPKRCGRLLVAVSRRHLRRGRRVRLTVRLSALRDDGSRVPAAGAVVRFGSSRATADARGLARVTYRPVGRYGLRRVRAAAPGLKGAFVRVRITH
jgi:S-formylglutathione hydrolase FrmB